MFELLQWIGGGVLLLFSCIYLHAVFHRDRYEDELDYACTLSFCPALDDRLTDSPQTNVMWLKFFLNVILPFITAKDVLFLNVLMCSGAPFNPNTAVFAVSGLLSFANLLFLRGIDEAAFFINFFAHLAFAATLFCSYPDAGRLPPLWAAVGLCCAAVNLAYFFRRKPLFFTAEPFFDSAEEDDTLHFEDGASGEFNGIDRLVVLEESPTPDCNRPVLDTPLPDAPVPYTPVKRPPVPPEYSVPPTLEQLYGRVPASQRPVYPERTPAEQLAWMLDENPDSGEP